MAQVQQTQARRRIRTRTSDKTRIASGTVKKKLDILTKALRDAQAAVQLATKQAKEASDEALKMMQAAHMDIHNCAYGELKVKTRPARCSTHIDPQVFHNTVSSDEAFYDAVQVQMGKAKEHLSGKEFDAIAVVSEGKKGDAQLKTEFYWPPEE